MIRTPLTTLLGIPHPVVRHPQAAVYFDGTVLMGFAPLLQILAGMAVVSSPPLAAAVSNAGGLGVIGAGFLNPSPDRLRRMISELKLLLRDPRTSGTAGPS